MDLNLAGDTKTTVVRKTGEARIVVEKRAYSAKNIGTTTIHVVTVTMK